MSVDEKIDWSPHMISEAIRVLGSIRYCQLRGELLPQQVFESLLSTHKKISTEVGIIHQKKVTDDGSIYLVQRPSFQENPYEPYPGQWCLPGVLHRPNETFEMTVQRLNRDELGGNIKSFSLIEKLEPIEADYPVRGLIQMIVLRIRLHKGDCPTNPRGKFFPFRELPDKLLEVQRRVLIPLVCPWFGKL